MKPSTLLIEHDYIIFCCRTRRSKELTRYFVRHIDDRVLEDDYDIQYIVPIAAKRKHWNVINFIINQVKKQIFKIRLTVCRAQFQSVSYLISEFEVAG